MSKALKISVLCALLLVVSFYVVGICAIRTFRLKAPLFAAAEKSPFSEVVRNVDALKDGVDKGTVPWRKVNISSIGFPEKEAKLLKLQTKVDLFTLRFGHLPSSIEDLSRLLEPSDYPAEGSRDIARLRKECEILDLGANSYVLDCDDLSSVLKGGTKELLKSFDQGTERFYEVHGHIIYYVPPATYGKPHN